MSIVGRFFPNELEDAAATYRLVQGIGSSICSFVTPLFVSPGASASTLRQLTVEMAVGSAIATCIMNEKQGGWVYVPPVLFAIMDTIYQTEVGRSG